MKKLLLTTVAVAMLSVLSSNIHAQLTIESLRNAGKFRGIADLGTPRPLIPYTPAPAPTSPVRINPSSILGSGGFNGLSGIEVPRSRLADVLGERSVPDPRPSGRLNPGAVINPDILGNLPRLRLPGTAPATPEGIRELPPGIVTPRPDGPSYEGDVIRVIPPRRIPIPVPVPVPVPARDFGPAGGAIEVPLPSPGPVIEVYPPGGVIVGTPVPTPATVPATTEAKPIPKLGIKGQIIANYGMKLLKVKADGLAAKAGLEAGDIIVRIGNASIVSLDAYDNAMATVAPDGHADFLVDDVRKRSQSNRLVVVRVNFEPAEPVVDR